MVLGINTTNLIDLTSIQSSIVSINILNKTNRHARPTFPCGYLIVYRFDWLTKCFQIAIRVELNQYKMNEMRVHHESRKNTLFYDVGNCIRPRFPILFQKNLFKSWHSVMITPSPPNKITNAQPVLTGLRLLSGTRARLALPILSTSYTVRVFLAMIKSVYAIFDYSRLFCDGISCYPWKYTKLNCSNFSLYCATIMVFILNCKYIQYNCTVYVKEIYWILIFKFKLNGFHLSFIFQHKSVPRVGFQPAGSVSAGRRQIGLDGFPTTGVC